MNFTIHDLHAQLVNKEISAVELTKKVIAHRDSVEKDVHAYLSLSDAKALEKRLKLTPRLQQEKKSLIWRAFREPLRIISASAEKPAQLHPGCWNTGLLPMMPLSLKT